MDAAQQRAVVRATLPSHLVTSDHSLALQLLGHLSANGDRGKLAMGWPQGLGTVPGRAAPSQGRWQGQGCEDLPLHGAAAVLLFLKMRRSVSSLDKKKSRGSAFGRQQPCAGRPGEDSSACGAQVLS